MGLLVTRVRQEWILEEALVDVVDDDGLPTANVVVVEEIGCAVGEVRAAWQSRGFFVHLCVVERKATVSFVLHFSSV